MTVDTAARALVVVAFDAAEREDYAIELAGKLGGAGTPELLGMFVENTQLLDHARSRLAREILLTGTERALDRHALERQLRSQAAHVRTLFESASTRLGLRHRFEVVRGDVIAEPIKRAATARALVVSLALGEGLPSRDLLRQLTSARLPLVLLARRGWLTGRTIAVVASKSLPATEAAIDAALQIAAQSGSPITVVVPTTIGGTSFVNETTDMLRSRGIDKSSVIRIDEAAVTGIVQATRACRARLLVMPSPPEADDAGIIEALLRRFSGSLMLVRHD